MKMEQTECSETSAYKIQTPGSYPEESIQIGECLGGLIEVCPGIFEEEIKKATKTVRQKWLIPRERLGQYMFRIQVWIIQTTPIGVVWIGNLKQVLRINR